ncbi:SET and MYND domain-containing protein 4-like [Choristoneura fumiferana]|uniref:SET and MYND domain-containing protein 4-like n=1 Tax=Choristoneura fumiferana TaxID=7141 RepID=UPI003D154362
MYYSENVMVNTHVLEKKGLLDEVYNALSAMDMSAAVLAVLGGMRQVGSLLIIHKTVKNTDLSRKFRTVGNEHNTSQRYLNALECYNKALLHAPLDSTELLHAYSNRSQLLFKLKAYTAAFKDIQTCFKLQCEGDLLKKLKKRKNECVKMMWEEKFKHDQFIKGFPEEFFKTNQKKHPDIPCLSADVEIVSESGERTVTAAKDITVGSVIALETAFTTYSSNNKGPVSCYYCQKLTLNLIPCDNCCFALFCDKECRKRCVNEYHEIECQIMDVLQLLNMGHRFNLTIKTVLKLKSKCKQWSKLIEESNNIGASRIKTSSVNQMYDVNQYSSILCFKEDRPFVFGHLFNNCFAYATVIHYLENISGFFPESPTDRLEAMKCIAKLCMTLDVMCPFITEIYDTVLNISTQELWTLNKRGHFGWFSFVGKLKHSCDPNVIIFGLNNRVALVAVKPIKKMTEITVSYVDHYYNQAYGERLKRATKLYQSTLNVCKCRVCEESWGIILHDKAMNSMQLESYLAWEFMKRTQMLHVQRNLMFKVTCTSLSKLSDLPNTKEHLAVYADLRAQLSMCQHAVTRNVMV